MPRATSQGQSLRRDTCSTKGSQWVLKEEAQEAHQMEIRILSLEPRRYQASKNAHALRLNSNQGSGNEMNIKSGLSNYNVLNALEASSISVNIKRWSGQTRLNKNLGACDRFRSIIKSSTKKNNSCEGIGWTGRPNESRGPSSTWG
jgi:hypothetical protein